MTSIKVSSETKREFDEMKPEDDTHDEFVEKLLAAKRRDDGEVVDVETIAEDVKEQVASAIEIAAYRGVQEALDDD